MVRYIYTCHSQNRYIFVKTRFINLHFRNLSKKLQTYATSLRHYQNRKFLCSFGWLKQHGLATTYIFKIEIVKIISSNLPVTAVKFFIKFSPIWFKCRLARYMQFRKKFQKLIYHLTDPHSDPACNFVIRSRVPGPIISLGLLGTKLLFIIKGKQITQQIMYNGYNSIDNKYNNNVNKKRTPSVINVTKTISSGNGWRSAFVCQMKCWRSVNPSYQV